MVVDANVLNINEHKFRFRPMYFFLKNSSQHVLPFVFLSMHPFFCVFPIKFRTISYIDNWW